jgi:predicted phosphate transport protein (TIGR00153 family)
MATGGYLSRIFSSSPVKPMQHHMEKVVACVSKLQPFFDAVVKGDWDQAGEIQQAISGLENEADDIKRDIRLHLPKGIFMPVSRVDLLEMLRIQDTVANKAKDIAGLMLGRKMDIPHEISGEMVEFVNRSVEATNQARTAINELDELFETGFRGAEVELVESMIKRLDAIEKQNDEQQIKLRASLFALEETLNPVQVMFLYKIIDWIGEIADRSQRVGSRLEYLLAR